MKNAIIIIFLVLMSSTFALSQSPLWQKTNDSFNEPISTLATSAKGYIFAGTYGKGIYCSKDKGQTWQLIGLQNKSIWSIAINSKGHIYAGTSRKGVFYSTNEGQTWTQINAGLDSSSYGDIIVNDLTFDQNDNLFAAASYRDMHRLTAKDSTWERIHFQKSSPTCFIFNPKGDIYVGLSNSTLVKSSDNAASWQEISRFPPYAGIASLAVNSQDHIFVSLWDSEGAGLYFSEQLRSTDNGRTWIKINTPVRNNDGPVHFAINNPGYIFSWANGGNEILAISFDNGVTWRTIDNGIEYDAGISSFVFSPDGSIYIGTRNSGVYRNAVDFSSAVKASSAKPDYYNLFQNYPNPFNAQTVIKYSLPNRTLVSLLIYDINGKFVRTLINEIENNGTHQVVWDGFDDNGKQIGSGVYLLQMQAGDYSSFRKLTIIK